MNQQTQPMQENSVTSAPSSGSGNLLKLLIGCFAAVTCLGICIVIAFFALTYAGINEAQNTARDTIRRAAGQDINVAMADYFSQYGTYPEKIVLGNDTITVSGDEGLVSVNSDTSFLSGTQELDFNSVFANENDLNKSEWCIAPYLSDGYAIAFRLEDGSWFNFGTSATPCEEAALDDRNAEIEDLYENTSDELRRRQPGLRDGSRHEILRYMERDLADFVNTNGSYPTALVLTQNQYFFTGEDTANFSGEWNESYTDPGITGEVTLNSSNRTAGSTTPDSTAYCYFLDRDGEFALGAKSEDDRSWINVGTSSELCSD
ncbi:MAG: hypothetical protein TR69_WS6001000033 [candidate division WS6 bacterium OLB20]|uniref:Uncharacterized protein n=1 Tax=candidate division WS6 bacterium OLB20 TaxID=1617426 RepID=A0A136M103_9BACT|nr:MAG: hypothetical protein TR69_WS6001000033 [candidate division WS6 bacterium OLB20]